MAGCKSDSAEHERSGTSRPGGLERDLQNRHPRQKLEPERQVVDEFEP